MKKGKIGRNDRCWCGSGKKYKHCHLGREEMDRPKFFKVDKDVKKFLKKKICLHPESEKGLCKGEIIKAHTLSKKFCLSKIATSGHVYSFHHPGHNFMSFYKDFLNIILY